MNKIILFIVGYCLMLGLSGCEQKIDTWSGENVAYVDMKADSTIVLFAYSDTEVDTVSVRVQVMGEVSMQKSRYVSVKVSEGNAIAGQDYVALEDKYKIESGEVFCTIPVIVKRPTDKSEKTIEVELVENEFFHLYYLEDVMVSGSDVKYTKTKHRIIFHSLMKEPPATWMESLFGKFTVTKMEKICSVMEITKAQFFSFSYMTWGRIDFIANYMKDYLLKYPVPDEDGKDMKMGDDLYTF